MGHNVVARSRAMTVLRDGPPGERELRDGIASDPLRAHARIKLAASLYGACGMG